MIIVVADQEQDLNNAKINLPQGQIVMVTIKIAMFTSKRNM